MSSSNEEPVWDGIPVDWDAEIRALLDELERDGVAARIGDRSAARTAGRDLRRLLPGVAVTGAGVPVAVLVACSAAPGAVSVPVAVWIGGWIAAGWWRSAGRPDVRRVAEGGLRAASRGARLIDRGYSRTATRVRTSITSSREVREETGAGSTDAVEEGTENR